MALAWSPSGGVEAGRCRRRPLLAGLLVALLEHRALGRGQGAGSSSASATARRAGRPAATGVVNAALVVWCAGPGWSPGRGPGPGLVARRPHLRAPTSSRARDRYRVRKAPPRTTVNST
jgi:hypothetical protein